MHIAIHSLIMTNPNPTPTNSNPYGHVVVKPVVPNTTINASMPAPVSTMNRESIIDSSQKQIADHNAMVLHYSGRRIGGYKRSKRSKRSNHKTRSKRSNRSKRGGENPTPTPSSKPVPVPQFAGAHNLGANANSLTGNHLLMKTGSQSVYDNTNAPPSNTVLNA